MRTWPLRTVLLGTAVSCFSCHPGAFAFHGFVRHLSSSRGNVKCSTEPHAPPIKFPVTLGRKPCVKYRFLILVSYTIDIYSRLRVTRTPGDRRKIIRKFILTDVQKIRSDCQMVNPFLGLRSRYALILELRRVYCRSLWTNDHDLISSSRDYVSFWNSVVGLTRPKLSYRKWI